MVLAHIDFSVISQLPQRNVSQGYIERCQRKLIPNRAYSPIQATVFQATIFYTSISVVIILK